MKSKKPLPYRISGVINGVLKLAAFAALAGGFLYGMYTLARDHLWPLLAP
jgi:hypothetical protein